MTAGMREYLEGLGPTGREKIRRDSVKSLRFSWPHRDSLRGGQVVRSNVTMLRNLREWPTPDKV